MLCIIFCCFGHLNKQTSSLLLQIFIPQAFEANASSSRGIQTLIDIEDVYRYIGKFHVIIYVGVYPRPSRPSFHSLLSSFTWFEKHPSCFHSALFKFYLVRELPMPCSWFCPPSGWEKKYLYIRISWSDLMHCIAEESRRMRKKHFHHCYMYHWWMLQYFWPKLKDFLLEEKPKLL